MEHQDFLPKDVTIDQTNGLQLKFSPEFEKECNTIKDVVDRTDNLVTLTNIDDADPEQVETAIKDLSIAQQTYKDIWQKRTFTKRWLTTNVVDNIMAQFDDKLAAARFNDLQSRDAQAKQLKKDLRTVRINKHWEEVEGAFKANVANYPLIAQMAPGLTDFNLFKLRHPKLVTGAKNWKFGDKQMAELNQDLYDINECLTDMQNNQMHLPQSYEMTLLQNFLSNPTKTSYLDFKNRVVNQYQIDVERAKAAEEAKKQAEENAKLQQAQQAQAGNQAQTQKSAQQQPMQQQAPVETELDKENAQREKVNGWLNQYVIANRLAYPNIANNDKQKTKLIYDLIHQLDNPNSKFSKFIQDSENPDNLELCVLKQILLV